MRLGSFVRSTAIPRQSIIIYNIDRGVNIYLVPGMDNHERAGRYDTQQCVRAFVFQPHYSFGFNAPAFRKLAHEQDFL